MGANMAEKWLQMIRWHQGLLTSASQNSDLHREELLDSVTHLSSNEAHLHGQNSGLAFSAASGGRNISFEHITTIVWYNRSPSTETRVPTYGCYDSTPFHWNLKQKAFWFSRECPSADPSTRILFRDIKDKAFVVVVVVFTVTLRQFEEESLFKFPTVAWQQSDGQLAVLAC